MRYKAEQYTTTPDDARSRDIKFSTTFTEAVDFVMKQARNTLSYRAALKHTIESRDMAETIGSLIDVDKLYKSYPDFRGASVLHGICGYSSQIYHDSKWGHTTHKWFEKPCGNLAMAGVFTEEGRRLDVMSCVPKRIRAKHLVIGDITHAEGYVRFEFDKGWVVYEHQPREEQDLGTSFPFWSSYQIKTRGLSPKKERKCL